MLFCWLLWMVFAVALPYLWKGILIWSILNPAFNLCFFKHTSFQTLRWVMWINTAQLLTKQNSAGKTCLMTFTTLLFCHLEMFEDQVLPQHGNIHCLSQKKSHTLIFCCTTFSLDYGTHLPWHRFDKLLQCHNNYFHPELHSFLPWRWTDDGRVRPLRKVFSKSSLHIVRERCSYFHY